jgi:hypothetical protein
MKISASARTICTISVRHILSIPLLVAALGVPAHANLVINPIFDASITGQGANGIAIENTINQAIDFFETTYKNPITVSIEFYANTTGLGESQVGFVYTPSYSSFFNDLNTEQANALALAGLISSGGNGPDNPVNGAANIDVKSANLRAVGVSGAAPLCNVVSSGVASDPLTCSGTAGGAGAVDGLIGLNTGITFPPNPQSGSTFSLLSTAEHEIDEVLGLGSSLPNCDSAAKTPCTSTSASLPAPEDLFRYTATHTFASLSDTCASLTPAYFSYSGATDIVNFNTACNGGDWGDWTGTTTVQNFTGGPNVTDPYSAFETDAMSAIGFQLTAPEPGTIGLLGVSLVALAFGTRLRRNQK